MDAEGGDLVAPSEQPAANVERQVEQALTAPEPSPGAEPASPPSRPQSGEVATSEFRGEPATGMAPVAAPESPGHDEAVPEAAVLADSTSVPSPQAVSSSEDLDFDEILRQEFSAYELPGDVPQVTAPPVVTSAPHDDDGDDFFLRGR